MAFQTAQNFDFNSPLFRFIKQGLIARIMPLFDESKNGRVKTKILCRLKRHYYIINSTQFNCPSWVSTYV